MIKGIIKDGKKLTIEDCKTRYGPMAALYIADDEERAIIHGLGIISATQIVDTTLICPRKVYYDYKLDLYVDLDHYWTINRGTLIHGGVLKKQKGYLIEERLFSVDGGMKWSGKPDAFDIERGRLYDLKTTKKIYGDVSAHHELQLNLYAYLLHKNGYRTVDSVLQKVSMTPHSKPLMDQRIVTIHVPNDIEIITMLTAAYKAKKELFGNPIAKWACEYCFAYRYCDTGMKVLEGKNLSNLEYENPPSCTDADEPITVKKLFRK